MLPGDSLKAQCRSSSELKLLGSQSVCEGSQYLRVFFHVLILKTVISLGVSISRRRKALPFLSDTKYLRLALRSWLSYISFPGVWTVCVPHRLTLSHSEANQSAQFSVLLEENFKNLTEGRERKCPLPALQHFSLIPRGKGWETLLHTVAEGDECLSSIIVV